MVKKKKDIWMNTLCFARLCGVEGSFSSYRPSFACFPNGAIFAVLLYSEETFKGTKLFYIKKHIF